MPSSTCLAVCGERCWHVGTVANGPANDAGIPSKSASWRIGRDSSSGIGPTRQGYPQRGKCRAFDTERSERGCAPTHPELLRILRAQALQRLTERFVVRVSLTASSAPRTTFEFVTILFPQVAEEHQRKK